MDFSFGAGLDQFRQEVREFIAQEWRADPTVVRDEDIPLEAVKEFRRKMARKGWLAASVPKEYGGGGLSIMEHYVVIEEMAYAHAPTAGIGANIVAVTLCRVGSEEQRKRFLPGVVSGETEFCLGYTEPAAGSDLASLQTRAVEDGDDYVVNGQKIFTSGAHHADYCWLAARTNPDVPQHKGISLFVVDMKSPGISVSPLWTMGGWHVNAVYWDAVRVPKKNLIGDVDRGWYYMATALDDERFAVNPVGTTKAAFDLLVQYVKETNRNGKPLRSDPDVREKMARLGCDLQMAELLHHRSAWVATQGIVPSVEASIHKLVTTELDQRLNHLSTQVLGLYGQLTNGSKYAPLQGAIERYHRASVVTTIAAGSNEIQRNIIATRGLGLPR